MILEYARREVVTARPDDTAQTVAGLMDYYGVGAVVIVAENRPVGIVTDRDLAMCLLKRQDEPEGDVRSKRASEIMTRTPATIREDLGFTHALEVMSQDGIRRLPVVDRQGRLRGIVTLDDLLAEVSRDMRAIGRLVHAQDRLTTKRKSRASA
jgi:CBS domain-containing protein